MTEQYNIDPLEESMGSQETPPSGPSGFDRLRASVGRTAGQVKQGLGERFSKQPEKDQEEAEWAYRFKKFLETPDEERSGDDREFAYEYSNYLADKEAYEAGSPGSTQVERQRITLQRFHQLPRDKKATKDALGYLKATAVNTGTWKGAGMKLSAGQMKSNKSLYLGDADKNLYYAKYSNKKSLYLPSVPTAEKGSTFVKAADTLRDATLTPKSLREANLPPQGMRSLNTVGRPKSSIDYTGLRKLSNPSGSSLRAPLSSPGSPLREMMVPPRATGAPLGSALRGSMGAFPGSTLRGTTGPRPFIKKLSSPIIATSRIPVTLRQPVARQRTNLSSGPTVARQSPITSSARGSFTLKSPSRPSPITMVARTRRGSRIQQGSISVRPSAGPRKTGFYIKGLR